MRICKVKATKRIIGMQSPCPVGELVGRAFVEFGLTPDQVEELEVDQAGYEAAKAEDPVEIAIAQVRAAAAAKEAAKIQTFLDNLPDWQTVNQVIDSANTIPKLQVIVKKLARVVYWLAKNSET